MLREEAGKPSRIFSASWARDEDISRYLKSLPNWLNLQEERTKGKKLVLFRFDSNTIAGLFDFFLSDLGTRNAKRLREYRS